MSSIAATHSNAPATRADNTPRSRDLLHLSGRERLLLASDLLPLFDCFTILFAAFASSLVYSMLFDAAAVAVTVEPNWATHGNLTLNASIIGAAFAPFVLYDRYFAERASQRHLLLLARSFLVRFVVTAIIVAIIARATRLLDHLPITWFLQWAFTTFALTACLRIVAARHVLAMQRRGSLTESIAVVCAGPIAEGLDRRLRLAQSGTVELIGVFDDEDNSSERLADIESARLRANRQVNSIDKLIELSKTRDIDWILIAAPPGDERRLNALLERLKVLSVRIALCPESIGLRLPHNSVDYVGNGMPVVLLADRPIKRWDSLIKSLEDIVLGGLITVLLLPVLLLIAIAIRIDSKGPVIFKQRRHAFNNTEFDIYKFRTMYWSAHNAAAHETLRQTSRDDPRITRVGRILRETSLDELPQLFNVLKGEMSLVGPRPHAVNMRTEDRLGSEITDRYAHRHRVKPGMTGWSQVHGARGATHTIAQLQRRIELDLYYIDHWSLLLDLKILLMTVRVVLKRTNAY